MTTTQNPSYGNREIERLLVDEGNPTHTYVANRQRALGIPNSQTVGSRFKGHDGSIVNLSSAKSEQEIEKAVARHYRTLSPMLDVRTQVPTLIGPADILVDGEILAVKLLLKREAIFKAVGQVFAYQSAVGDSNKHGAIVAGGYASSERALIDQVIKLGVRVLFWNDKRLISWEKFCTASPHPVKLDG